MDALAELVRESLPYATCLSNAEWVVVDPLLPAPAATGRPRLWPMRAMFDGKAAAYDLLFRAASTTMARIAADPKHLGARIGLTAVLHTWGSAMTHQSRCLSPGHASPCAECQDGVDGAVTQDRQARSLALGTGLARRPVADVGGRGLRVA